METSNMVDEWLAKFTPELANDFRQSGIEKTIPEGTEILREGQYIKSIPIVFDGLIKVFRTFEEKELLLYYIRPFESCIMSFAASMANEPSKVFAITEENSMVFLLPVDKVSKWIVQYPDINSLFFAQYNLRYSELLDTIHHVLFNKMDQRLMKYLTEKSGLTGKNPLTLTHRQIASELGTAREVISRVMKKLEAEGKVIQLTSNQIKILLW